MTKKYEITTLLHCLVCDMVHSCTVFPSLKILLHTHTISHHNIFITKEGKIEQSSDLHTLQFVILGAVANTFNCTFQLP